MVRAAIDVGSHSVKLTIADRTASGWRSVLEKVTVTGLGRSCPEVYGLDPVGRTTGHHCITARHHKTFDHLFIGGVPEPVPHFLVERFIRADAPRHGAVAQTVKRLFMIINLADGLQHQPLAEFIIFNTDPVIIRREIISLPAFPDTG